jgi:Fe-S cluster assembly iron-binding protein IscA
VALVLTDNASSVIKTLTDNNSDTADDVGLRIAPSAEGERPTDLAVSLVGEPAEQDEVLEQDGAKVFLDPGAADMLEDKVLDATVEPDGRVRFLVSVQ